MKKNNIKPFFAILFFIGSNIATTFAQQRKVDMGVVQQPAKTMQWFDDYKYGMFIHWGPYSAAAKGEWYLYQDSLTYRQYAKYYTPSDSDTYFDASKYNPALWVKIAKDAGMKYMVLTARHHDDFALFKTSFPGSLSAYNTLHRDLIKEYVNALRKANMRVGLYFSVLSWRFPGYFDVTGTHAVPNNWNYTTEAWHKQNATEMKAELYSELKTLMTNYGKIDLLWFDGGWLGLQGTDRAAAYFWEPGLYRSDNNEWKGDFGLKAPNGHYYGIMGMVRKLQPQIIANARSGWIGDYDNDEGGSEVKGPIRKEHWEKCMNLNEVTWGYNTKQNLASAKRVVTMLVNCVVRNGNLLLNVGPDAHGVIPLAHAARLKEVGDWLKEVGTSIYGTTAGPWQPKDEAYGFTQKPNKIFIHILEKYKGTTFTIPSIKHKIKRCIDLLSKQKLVFKQSKDGSSVISGINRELHPSDTVIEIDF